MEKYVLNLLSEELQFCAKNLINDVKKVMECFKFEPTDLNEFANYTSTVFICFHLKVNLWQIICSPFMLLESVVTIAFMCR